MIPYGRQDITQLDIDAVIEVLNSDFLTQGPCVPEFEKKLAEYVGAKHAVAVNSATSALHIACLALGLGEGDWLWTTPITFVASANCGIYCGAKVDFVDIDPKTNNICPRALESKLILAEREGTLPKILVPVHFAGMPCDMRAIFNLGKKYGFNIIEYASHAIGGRYESEPIGNCKFSDMTIFSFHPVKIITTGEGGAVITNNAIFDERLRLLRSHGITRDEKLMINSSEGAWHYEQVMLGFNYRMTDLQAALGNSQMKRIDSYVLRRCEIARFYQQHLEDLPLILPEISDKSSWHLYVIRIDKSKTDKTRFEVFNHMRNQGIGVNVHYIPVHTQPFYRNLGFRTGDFPISELFYSQAISLPIYPAITRNQLDEVVVSIKSALEN